MASLATVFKATPIRAVDGDTFDAYIHLGFGFDYYCTVRIMGIDTPEIGTNKGVEALKCKQTLQSVLAAQRIVILELKSSFTDKYGRALATVRIDSGDDIVKSLDPQYLVPGRPESVAQRTVCSIFDPGPQSPIVIE